MSEELRSQPQEGAKDKTRYFSSLATKYLSEMKLLFRGGKLTRRDAEGKKLPPDSRENWSNIAEHCFTQAAIIEALSDNLGFSEVEKERLAQAAILSDWDTRLSKRGTDWADGEAEAAREKLRRLEPDQTLLNATTPGFLEHCLVKGKATLQEKMLAYADDISEGSGIMPFEPRFKKADARWPELGKDPIWYEKLAPVLGPGKGYWDGQIAMVTAIQQEIFEALRQKGAAVDSPDELPAFIKSEIEKRYTAAA